MSAPLTIYFIRHGEVHNPEHILYGRMPGYGLSTTGRGQASATAHALKDIKLDALYSSPMQRAQETAQIIATRQATMPEIQTDERINEIYTPYDGTPHSELEKTMFDIYAGNQPPYEQPADVRARLLNFLQDMRRRHAQQRIAAVTHGDIVVTAFLYAMQYTGDDIARGKLVELGLPEPYPVTASMSVLTYRTDAADELPTYLYRRPY